MKMPKIKMLVLSNDPFGKSNSVGRTLASVLCDSTDFYDVAMFYTRNSLPDFPIMTYFRITDSEALHGFFKPKKIGSEIHWANGTANTQNSTSKVHKTSFKMLIRDFIWRRVFKRDVALREWIDSFNPDVVVLNGYDTAFLFRKAALISKKRDIPLVIYTAEDYPFKKWDPYKRNGKSNPLYWIWHRVFRRAYLKAYNQSSLNLYTDQDMEDAYKIDFPNQNCLVTMTASTAPGCDYHSTASKPISVLYAGSLPGRYESLLAIADALLEADPLSKLIVYCVSTTSKEALALKSRPNIEIRSFIENDQLNRIIWMQDLVLNVEDFLPYWVKDRRRCYSTKVSNCLSCGIPFLDFSPEQCFTTRYLKEKDAAFVISDPKDLPSFFKHFRNDLAFRTIHLENARRCVLEDLNAKATQTAVYLKIKEILSKKTK
jgi:hypothetical protein